MPRKTARNKEEKVKIIPQDCVSNFKGENMPHRKR